MTKGPRHLAGGVVLSAGVILAACGPQPSPPTIGHPVPEVVLPDLEGRTVRLSDFRGEVVVLNFWATWCPPCVDEMPSLEKLHRALGPKGLRVVAVSVDQSLKDIEQFREKYELSFPILHDDGAKVSHAFFTFKYPETYVLDRDGILVSKTIGPRDWVAPMVIHDLVELVRTKDEV